MKIHKRKRFEIRQSSFDQWLVTWRGEWLRWGGMEEMRRDAAITACRGTRQQHWKRGRCTGGGGTDAPITNFKYVKPVSDVWSFAASIYQLLTGKFPYRFDPKRDPIDIILNENPVPIGERMPGLAKDIAAVIDQALVRNPKDRFPDAGKLLASAPSSSSTTSRNSSASRTTKMTA